MIDSTLAGNAAQGGNSGGTGGGAMGGAIFNLDGTVDLYSDTFASNTVTAGANAFYTGSDSALGNDVYDLAFGHDLTDPSPPAPRSIWTVSSSAVAPRAAAPIW